VSFLEFHRERFPKLVRMREEARRNNADLHCEVPTKSQGPSGPSLPLGP